MLAERHSKKLETSSFYVPEFDRTVVLSIDVRRDMSRQWMEGVVQLQMVRRTRPRASPTGEN